MCFKMLLLSFYFCIILAMGESGNIVFMNSQKENESDNVTIRTSELIAKPSKFATTSTYRPSSYSTSSYSTPSYSTPSNTSTPSSIISNMTVLNTTTYSVETMKLGLLNATLNMDRSIDKQNTCDPNSDHNVIISPISITAAMSLVLLAAKGETQVELSKLYGFDKNLFSSPVNENDQLFKTFGSLLNNIQVNYGSTLVNIAKAIFIQNDYNITTKYKTAAKEYLNTELINVNFKSNGILAQRTINQWVSNQTNGKISDIMPIVPLPDTKTIIASALYFSGQWENPFFVNYTRIRPFYVGSNDGKKIPRQSKDFVYVPMMLGSSEVLYHKNDELEFKAIGLPYQGKKLITYFVLPNQNVNLRDLIAKMNPSTLNNITRNSKLADFTYMVPKMTLESFTNLRPVLQDLGVNKIFDPFKADLSNMASVPGSYISDILHKVEIKIDEIGTVAAAATVITITRGGQLTFNVNRPFLFFIHHVESDSVIFWSSVNKPSPYSTIPPPLNSNKKT